MREAYEGIARVKKVGSLPEVLEGLWERWNPPCELTDSEDDYGMTVQAALMLDLEHDVRGRRVPSAALILVAKAYGLKGEESLRVILNGAGYSLTKNQLHPQMAFTVSTPAPSVTST